MFREVIHQELERRGWTTYKLVEETGIGRATVYDYLNGKREIQTDSLESIFRTLELEIRHTSD